MTHPSDPLDALAHTRGRTGWIISDGKAGNETQTRGVFDALGLDYEIKRINPGRLQKLLSPYLPVARSERFGHPASSFRPPWPDFAISIGRLTTPYIRALRKAAGMRTYTIILQDPKVSLSTADLFWMPEHDKRRGANVVTTLTAPHGFTGQRLAALRAKGPPDAFAHLPRPWTAIVLGGNNDVYRYTSEDEARLAAILGSVAALGGSLVITPSRRTQPELLAAVDAATRTMPRFLWDGSGENPYPAMLAFCDRFIVTADSVNMCGEPAVTGKPIHVFSPSGGSAKFQRYHEALATRGITQPISGPVTALDSWSYTPIESAHAIAVQIAVRWLRRRRILPGLTGADAEEGRDGAHGR